MAALAHGLWILLVATAFVIVLSPLDGAEGSMKTAEWLAAYPAAVAGRLYSLIRIAMPWLVVGTLLTLVWPRPAIQRWALAAAAGCVVAGWLLMPDLEWNHVRELLFVFPGIWVGIWIGEQAQQARVVDLPPVRSASAAIGLVMTHDPPAEASREPWTAAPQQPGVRVLVARVAAVAMLCVVLWTLIDFPIGRLALGLGLAVYAAVSWKWPSAWLLVVPIALPLLDLAPWTGRFFWDEFDLLMLTTLAVGWWQGRFTAAAWRVPMLRWLLPAFVLASGVSLLLGLLPLPAWDANVFSAYWSPYNGLRLAKGLLWGLVFYGLYRSMSDSNAAFVTLCAGMALGVLGVSAWALWEQMLFAGAAQGVDYRVTGSFSSMHTGGGHFEAYLVIALPFVWGLIFASKRWLLRVVLGLVFLLGAYALFSTVARGGAIALGVALVILVGGTGLALGRGARPAVRFAVPAVLGLATVAVMIAGASGAFWQQRLAQTSTDASIRLGHWAEILGLRDGGLTTMLFGQGLGRLPAANLGSQLPERAGSYQYTDDHGNIHLALNSAGTLYMAQRVTPHAGQTLTLQLTARAPRGKAGLEASLCEKNLFNSHRCQWLKLQVPPADKNWHTLSQTFSSGEVGAGNWFTRRPVQFSLYNPIPGTVIEVDSIRLLDGAGRDLLKNGDFARGGDFWFFKSGDHLFWHAKNLWVHLLFEQGWIGTLLFALILLWALVNLVRKTGQGAIEPTVWLAAIGALVTVGMVESLLDAPRLAQLVYAALFVGGALSVPARRASVP